MLNSTLTGYCYGKKPRSITTWRGIESQSLLSYLCYISGTSDKSLSSTTDSSSLESWSSRNDISSNSSTSRPASNSTTSPLSPLSTDAPHAECGSCIDQAKSTSQLGKPVDNLLSKNISPADACTQRCLEVEKLETVNHSLIDRLSSVEEERDVLAARITSRDDITS